jgi:hypothetical protein
VCVYIYIYIYKVEYLGKEIIYLFLYSFFSFFIKKDKRAFLVYGIAK